MSIRFAGSRFVHERRRRRLAQECGGVSVVPVEDENAQDGFDEDTDLPATTTLGHSPVSSIIRPQLWVHWTVTVLCLIAWGGMLYLGDLAERTDVGLRDILGLRAGRLTTFFSTIMLLWAGQLSLLIYWYRRKSRNDFAGRYRIWLWICGMLQMFLVVAATGAHRPFAVYMQRMWPTNIPMYDLLSWLVPVSTLGLTLYRLLRIELKRHRSGKFLLNLAGVSGVIAATSLVIGRLLPERARDLIQIGSATLTHLSLATALLMHARYVVHISNEVPRRERRSRRLMTALRGTAGYLPMANRVRFGRPTLRLPTLSLPRPGIPRLRLPRLSLPKVSLPNVSLRRVPVPKLSVPSLKLPRPKFPQLRKPKQTSAVETSDAKPQATRKDSDSSQATQAAGTKASPKQPSVQGKKSVETRAVVTSRKKRHRVDAANAPNGPVNKQSSADKSNKPAKSSRSLDDILNEYECDEEIDADVLRGLSKKERRRLRKKRRELQRTGQ